MKTPFTLFLASFALAISGKMNAAPGDLDTSFGNAGIVTTSVSIPSNGPRNMLVLSDGKILAAGFHYGNQNSLKLARYNADGSPDPSFGTGGVSIIEVTGRTDGITLANHLDGKIVVAASMSGPGGLDNDFSVTRFNGDGSLDLTFNGTGTAKTPIGTNTEDDVRSVAVQTDGKTLVTGYSLSGSTYSMVLVRYNADGSLDTSFNGTGVVTNNWGGTTGLAYSVAAQSDGRILVAGITANGGNQDFAILRYNTNGSLDTSFSGDGKVTTDVGGYRDAASSLAVQPDGKIVVAGSAESSLNSGSFKFAVARYTASGGLDTSFSGDGKTTTDISGYRDFANSVVVQADGKIVAAGNAAFNTLLGIIRYNVDGSLDTSFSGDGIVTTVLGGGTGPQIPIGYCVAMQSDGKIVAAGGGLGDSLISMVRYLGGPPEIAVAQPSATNIPDGGSRSFGSVLVGTFAELLFTVRNTGTADLTGLEISIDGSDADQFSISEYPVAPVNPGGTATFAVQFSPTSGGTKTANLHIGNNDPDENPFDIILTGSDLSPEIAVAQPSATNIPDGGSKSFGSVAMGSNSSLVFTVRNTGNANLTGLGITLDGANATDFSVTANPTVPVPAPNGGTTFTIMFTPGGVGVRTSTIHVANNDLNENPFDITLTGTGVVPIADWRQFHFGDTANSGDGANFNDYEFDGLVNLIEYAFGLNPAQNSAGQLPQGQIAGANFVLGFTEPAGVTGITYGAEWSTTMAANDWLPIADTGTPPQHTFSVPISPDMFMFIRLKLAAAP